MNTDALRYILFTIVIGAFIIWYFNVVIKKLEFWEISKKSLKSRVKKMGLWKTMNKFLETVGKKIDLLFDTEGDNFARVVTVIFFSGSIIFLIWFLFYWKPEPPDKEKFYTTYECVVVDKYVQGIFKKDYVLTVSLPYGKIHDFYDKYLYYNYNVNDTIIVEVFDFNNNHDFFDTFEVIEIGEEIINETFNE